MEIHRTEKNISDLFTKNRSPTNVLFAVEARMEKLKLNDDMNFVIILKKQFSTCFRILSKGFADASNLTKHCQSHTKETCFKCDECGQNFTQSGSLRLHVWKHHGKTLPDRIETDKDKIQEVNFHFYRQKFQEQFLDVEIEKSFFKAS